MTARRASLLVAVALACGCAGGGDRNWVGSNGPGLGSASGTWVGNPITVQSAYSGVVPDGSAGSYGVVLLSSAPDLCATLESGHEPGGADYVVISLAYISSTAVAPPTGPDTFQVVPQSSVPIGADALVTYGRLSGDCTSFVQSSTGASGTIQLTDVAGAGYSGHGDFRSSTGETDGVQFHAGACSTQAIYGFLNGTLPCQ